MVMASRYRKIYNNKIKQLAVRYADIGDSFAVLTKLGNSIWDTVNTTDKYSDFSDVERMLDKFILICHNLLSNPLFVKNDAPVRISGFGGWTWVSAVDTLLLKVAKNCSDYLKNEAPGIGELRSTLRQLDLVYLRDLPGQLSDTWESASRYQNINPADYYR